MITVTLDLSSYSDEQILDFMYQGIISREEYAAEFRRRVDERIRNTRKDGEGDQDKVLH